VQTGSDLRLRITSREALSEQDEAGLRRRLAIAHPDLATIALERVEALSLSVAGKTPMILRVRLDPLVQTSSHESGTLRSILPIAPLGAITTFRGLRASHAAHQLNVLFEMMKWRHCAHQPEVLVVGVRAVVRDELDRVVVWMCSRAQSG
jgi:hypothetical protein